MKVRYHIEGFDCPACANKAIELLKQDAAIKGCSLDYAGQVLSVEYSGSPYPQEDLSEIITTLSGDEVVVREESNGSKDYHVKVINREIIAIIVKIAISATLLCIAQFAIKPFAETLYSWQWWTMLSVFAVSYLVIAFSYIVKFVKNLAHPKTILNENTLMLIASIGAFALQEYPEAILVLLLGQVGEILEDVSISRSRNLIIDAIDMRAKTATAIKDGKTVEVAADSIVIGDVLVIKMGEAVPTDGIIVSGEGEVDTSSITGEFAPVSVREGDNVYSGSVLSSGSFNLKATSNYNDSTTSKILDMVVESGEHKSKAERFITKFARYYTPIVCLLALLVAVIPPLAICLSSGNWLWATWSDYLYRALVFLVISCPCAIVISVPLCFFTGIGLASKHGIIVKGANYLDRINDVKTLVTDKTGTLTTGKFSIAREVPISISKDEFEMYVLYSEQRSNHPIAHGIVDSLTNAKHCESQGKYDEIPGFGIETELDGKQILFGNEALMSKHGIVFDKPEEALTVLYLAVGNVYHGYILVDDTPKEHSKQFVYGLSARGIKTVMLTGGRKESASYMADLLGIQEYHSDLLPGDKIEYLKAEMDKVGKHQAVAFVGDGVNDAPSIILSDVGFAMGGLGSDSSVGNADVVIMNDDPLKILESMEIARAARIRSIVCIAVSIFVKVGVMVLAALSLVDMWVAVLADSGLMAILVVYAVLLIKKNIKFKGLEKQ